MPQAMSSERNRHAVGAGTDRVTSCSEDPILVFVEGFECRLRTI